MSIFVSSFNKEKWLIAKLWLDWGVDLELLPARAVVKPKGCRAPIVADSQPSTSGVTGDYMRPPYSTIDGGFHPESLLGGRHAVDIFIDSYTIYCIPDNKH